MFTTRSDLLRRHLDRFTESLNHVAKGDVRALHQARVASRRLRELLPILHLDREARRKMSRRLRKVTRRLGAVRELDVMVMLIDELRISGRGSQPLSRVAVAVSKERDDARMRLVDRMAVDDMRRSARKLARFAARLEDTAAARASSPNVWRWAVDARIAHRAARLSAAIADAGAVYLPERLHEVRIALKKLRYALELASEIDGEPRTADVRALRRAQDTLGRVHDLQVLTDRVRTVQASLTPPGIAMWRGFDRLMMSLEDDCRQLHARYMRQRGRLEAIAARVGSAVQDGRHQTSPSEQRRIDQARDTAETDRRSRRSVAV
jgi:CHAD domain-containing protein